jgi:hypothetical protein
MTEYVVRFLVGGIVVLAFATLRDILSPKSFAGLFGATPSVALATQFMIVPAKKSPPGRAGFSLLLALLIHVLRHLEMMLQVGERFAGPILQLRIIAALRIALK